MESRFRDVGTSMSCFVSHLECSYTGEVHEKGQVYNLSRAGYPLLVRYDLDAIKHGFSKSDLHARANSLWRYRELLPMVDEGSIVSLGEVVTPMVELNKVSEGAGTVWVKDEGRLPTGSFKARGLVMAITMAKELGIQSVAMPTNWQCRGRLKRLCHPGWNEERGVLPCGYARGQYQ